MMNLVVRPAAANGLRRAYRWYEEQRPGLGGELLDEVQVVIDRMLLLPRHIRSSIVIRDVR